MTSVALLGIDIGKHTFYLHGQDQHGHQVLRKKYSRRQLIDVLANTPVCTVVMESCAGAHWLARKLAESGHQVKLIAPQYVKPFLKGNKNDYNDAEAICEAAARPSMRFVAVKTPEQQTLSALHRLRESLIAHRTAAINQVHGFLLEFGVSLPIGMASIQRLPALLDDPVHALPPRLVQVLLRLHARIKGLSAEIKDIEAELARQLQDDDAGRRLLSIPGIGPISASALAAEAGDASQFKCGRDFAASLGLVPRQYSTGGKQTLLGISKRGDKHLRRLLVQGARAVMQRADRRDDALGTWLRGLLGRRHSNVVACALANKLARIVWAVLAKGGQYQPHPHAV
ncbi:IS110 family transposase [Jeongeupia sp. USM3]|uniref:IS110 family transposase n=1 Tax=Jeongeupia sp. USM3 TaxID=1906741 RepID=UPI00089DF6DB|nr:IS110 family transposase [Jeongeupia sp. USM3]AOY01367.1 IS110 family transposase [Jeongeupia sp. USM3]